MRTYFYRKIFIAGLASMGLVFIPFVSYKIAPFYPPHTDQAFYLVKAYNYYERAQKEGYLKTLREHFSHKDRYLGHQPNINCHMSLAASFLFAFCGPNRLGALTFHLLSWLVLLSVTFWVVKKLTKNWSWSYLSVSLLLWCNFAFIQPGGISDFRMEFSAACWMGITALLWFLFLHHPYQRYAWLAAGATIFLIFFRIITLTYWIPLLVFVGFLTFWRFKFRKQKFSLRLLYPIFVIGLIGSVLIIWDFDFLRQYYFNAQLGNAEMFARGADNTFKDINTALLYYPRALLIEHIGLKCLLLLFILGLLGTIHLIQKQKSRNSIPIRWTGIIFLAIVALLPIFILSLNPHRTFQVASISVVSLVTTLFFLALKIIPRTIFKQQQWLPVLCFILSITAWITYLSRSSIFHGPRLRDAITLNSIYNLAADHLFELQTQNAAIPPSTTYTIAILDSVDGLSGECLDIYCSEKSLFLAPITTGIGKGILTRTKDSMIKEAEKAEIAIVPIDADILNQRSFPITKSIYENYNDLVKLIRTKMIKKREFTYNHVRYELYFSPLPKEAFSS